MKLTWLAVAGIATLLCSAAPAQEMLGDWRIATAEGHQLMEAKQTAESDPSTTLSIRCDENAGLELWLTSMNSFHTGPQTEATILLDGTPTGTLVARAAVPVVDLPFLKLAGAQAMGQKIAHAHRIGVRITSVVGDTSTYYFDFPNLAAGTKALQKRCPV